MIASLRAELLKSRKRWATWILLAVLVAFVIVIDYIVLYLVTSHPPPRFESPIPAAVLKRETYPENLLANVLSLMPSIGAAVMIILGGLSVASEYGWVTVQTILVQRPGRAAVLAGKLLNLAILVTVFALLVFASAALTAYILKTVDGATSAWPSAAVLLKGFGAALLQLGVWTAFGMFLGVAFRSTAAAIGGGLVYLFVVEAIISRFFSNTDIIKEILKLLPGVNGGAINEAFPLTFHNPAAPTPLVSVEHGVITLVAYLVAFALLAFLIFQRRDVTGG